jgi:mannitol-specific phosphotransferase system IIBC component
MNTGPASSRARATASPGSIFFGLGPSALQPLARFLFSFFSGPLLRSRFLFLCFFVFSCLVEPSLVEPKDKKQKRKKRKRKQRKSKKAKKKQKSKKAKKAKKHKSKKGKKAQKAKTE